MPPVARLRHLLLPLLVLFTVVAAAPATAAAAPRAAHPAAATQDPADPGDGADDDGWEDLDGDGWPDADEWTDDSGFDDGTDTADPVAVPVPVTTVPSAVPTAVPTPVATPKPVWPKRPVVPEVPLVTTATVAGKVAQLRRDGRAAIPRGAPLRVRRVIAAANRIVGKPYKWGGGHAKLEDRGYDCSGTVSYALIRAQLLASPMVSGTLATWGRAGAGRWITIFANKGHVYMEVAGLRLDTSAMGDPRGGSGPRWRPVIGKRRGFHVRHLAGL